MARMNEAPEQAPEPDPVALLEDALITIEVGVRAVREVLRRLHGRSLDDLPRDLEPTS